MEEEGIMALCARDEPLHSFYHVFSGGEFAGVLGVVCEKHNVSFFVSLPT